MSSAANNTTSLRPVLKPSDVVLQKIHYLKITLYPICFFLLIAGFILAVTAITRPKIRKHSSSLYLVAMVFLDIVWACGGFLPTLIASEYPDMVMHPSTCRYTQALEFIGKTGSSMVILMLSLERVLALSFPRRMEKMLPKILIVLCVVSLAVICAGGSYSALEYAWESNIRKRCAFVTYGAQGRGGTPWIIIIVPLVLLFIQSILNILLAVFIYRKKQTRQVDPLQTAMSAVRQKSSSQLNKINLISFVMCLLYWITTFVFEFGRWYFQLSLARAVNKAAVIDEALLVYEITYTFALIVISVKVYVIAAISKVIRRETWKALTCSEYRSRQRLSEHIKPKHCSQDGLNLDVTKSEDYDANAHSATNPAGPAGLYYEEQL